MKKNLMIALSALLLSSTFTLSFADEHSDVCNHKDKAQMCQGHFDAKKMKVTEKDIENCVEGIKKACEAPKDKKAEEMFKIGMELAKNPSK